VKKLKNKCGVGSVLKKVAPGCPISDRWGVGIRFASNSKPGNFSRIDFHIFQTGRNPITRMPVSARRQAALNIKFS
jgi:hypothetical protein